MERGKEFWRKTVVVKPIPTEVNARYRTIVIMRSNTLVDASIWKKKRIRIFVSAHNNLRLCLLLVEVVKPIRSSIKYFVWAKLRALNRAELIRMNRVEISRDWWIRKNRLMIREDEKYYLNKEIRVETNIWQLKKCEHFNVSMSSVSYARILNRLIE